MRNNLTKRFLRWPFDSVRHSWWRPFLRVRAQSRLCSCQNGGKIPDGLHLALAKKGITVKDKAFLNLKPFELQDKGARKTDPLTNLPIYMRGIPGASDISKAQFSKLMKEVISHLSSEPTIFIRDAALGFSAKCDAKVRIISDSPSAVFLLSEFLWEASTRAISHDPCPMTVYSATSISPKIAEIVGIDSISKATSGFLAADIESASLILFGKSFADANGSKSALAALAAPVITARNGVPLHARILAFGDSVNLFFAPESVLRCCTELHDVFLSRDAGTILFSLGVAPFFRTKCSASPVLPEKPASLILATIDSSCALPTISNISPGQAAYHFLAGYEDGKFLPAYERGPSLIPPVELAKALLSYLVDNDIPSYLVNLYRGGKHIEGAELLKLVESAYSNSVSGSCSDSRSDPKVAHLKGRYKSFMAEKFPNLPENVTF